jgi:uncharacterized protein YndB with AHSA1/START domain
VRRVEVERLIPHPLEKVFARYTDHVGWSGWAGLGRVSLVREGTPERDGKGCVRAFSTAPGLREEVTLFEPPRRMEYRIVRGPVPMADHRGEVCFVPEGSGTRVTWRVTFRSRVPGLGFVIERGLGVLFGRILAAFARDLDATGR